MTRTFLPQADVATVGPDSFKPIFRWWREDDFRFVPGSKATPSRTAARTAAEDYLAAGLNKQLGGPVEPEADILGIDDWRQRKAETAATERERVFGSEQTAIYRNGREIRIERRRRA